MKAGRRADARRQTYSMVARAEGMVATRERIVQAALKLLLEQAYEDVTLVAIAEAAGVSHQTVLNHFASKENVGAAAAEMLSRQTQDVRDRAVPDDQPGAIAILVGEYRAVRRSRRTVGDGVRAAWLAGAAARSRTRRSPGMARSHLFGSPAEGAGRASARHSRAACGHGCLHMEAPPPRPSAVPRRHRADPARTGRRDP